jgi:hypothetical protein
MQEWPDTLMVTYDYPGYLLTYEMRVWNAYHLHDESEGAALYGDNGSIIIGNARWRAFDAKGKLVKEDAAGYNDVGHAHNFTECMRSRQSRRPTWKPSGTRRACCATWATLPGGPVARCGSIPRPTLLATTKRPTAC